MKRTMRNWSQLAAGILLLASCKEAPQMPTTGGYQTMKVATTDKTLSESYSATIRGRQDIEIYPQVQGKIEQLCVAEGEKVRRAAGGTSGGAGGERSQ